VTSVQCVDDFTVFANQALGLFTPAEESSGERVQDVLTRPEVVYQGGTAISTGASTLGAFEVSEGTNVMQYLQAVTASEQGFMFMSAGGVFTFTSRADALNPAPVIDFSDDGTGIRYQALTNAYGDELLYNLIQTGSPAGAVQTASDPDSIALYQSQVLSKTDLLNSTVAEVDALGEYLLGRYKDPQVRFTGVSTQLAALSATDQNTCLSVDLTDIAAITKTFDTGSPATVTQTLITSGVAHEITPGSHVIRFTYESTDGNARAGVLTHDPEDARSIREDIRELREAVATVERLQREANGRLGKTEGRVFEIELWRARLQGVAATSRVGWMLAGGAVTGVVVAMINNS
jgi:hypothetical protein